MIFVWTLDSVIAVILFGILALSFLFFLLMWLIGSVVELIQRWTPYKGEKTHKTESEDT